jgi:hypothetical protein
MPVRFKGWAGSTPHERKRPSLPCFPFARRRIVHGWSAGVSSRRGRRRPGPSKNAVSLPPGGSLNRTGSGSYRARGSDCANGVIRG